MLPRHEVASPALDSGDLGAWRTAASDPRVGLKNGQMIPNGRAFTMCGNVVRRLLAEGRLSVEVLHARSTAPASLDPAGS
jgi:hypothetical protein